MNATGLALGNLRFSVRFRGALPIAFSSTLLGHPQGRLSEDGRGTCDVLELLFPFQVRLPEVAIQTALPGERTTGRRGISCMLCPSSPGGQLYCRWCVYLQCFSLCPLLVCPWIGLICKHSLLFYRSANVWLTCA